MNGVTIDPATEADLPLILRENDQAVPNVNRLAPDELDALLAMSRACLVARVDGRFAGFMVLMEPGKDYASLNYRWFSERYPDFLYVDRVVVSEAFRGQGVGKALYRAAAGLDGVGRLVACEVNLRPRNEPSLAFHRSLGFTEVGQQDTEGGDKRVSLLVRAAM